VRSKLCVHLDKLVAVETYLRRSGQVPLKISICGTVELPPANEMMKKLGSLVLVRDAKHQTLVTTVTNMPSMIRGSIPWLTC
jgi:hypothetical protein